MMRNLILAALRKKLLLCSIATFSVFSLPAFAQTVSGGGMPPNGAGASPAALNALAVAAGQTGGLGPIGTPSFQNLTLNTTQVFQGIVINNGAGNQVIKILCDDAAAPPAGCDGGVIGLFNGSTMLGDHPKIEFLAGAPNSYLQAGNNLILGADGKDYPGDEQLVISRGKSIAWMDTSGSVVPSDVGLSSPAAGWIYVGNGTPGSFAGNLRAGVGLFGIGNQISSQNYLSVEDNVQNTGQSWGNGFVEYATLTGTSSANDGGLLRLLNGGSALVQIAAAGDVLFDNTGKVGVGLLTSPTFKFQVTQAAQFNGIGLTNGSVTVARLIGNTTSGDGGTLVLSNNGTDYITISANGSSQFNSGGVEIGAPTGGAEGAGTLNLGGLYYANGVPGASCAVNTPAHLTVVAGLVVLCN